MKRRSLTVLLCLLAIISLASVGFASWVISADDTQDVTGNIQVDTVTDHRLEIVVTELAEGQNRNINLLAPSKDAQTIDGAWLKGEGTDSEQLEVVIDFTVKYQDKTKTEAPTAKVTYEWSEQTEKLLAKAVAAKYIKEPNVVIENNGNGEYTATITFAWGDLFKLENENVNPYVFYNNKAIDGQSSTEGETWAEHAIRTLTELETMFEEASYNITLKAEFAATAEPGVTQ